MAWLGPISSGSSVKMTSPGAMSRVATTYRPNLTRIQIQIYNIYKRESIVYELTLHFS